MFKNNGIVTPEIEKEMRARNEQRARKAIETLGKNYVCHPENKVQRGAFLLPDICRTLLRY